MRVSGSSGGAHCLNRCGELKQAVFSRINLYPGSPLAGMKHMELIKRESRTVLLHKTLGLPGGRRKGKEITCERNSSLVPFRLV